MRPQLAAWERPVPSGGGVSGLWRATAPSEQRGLDPLQLNVAGDTLYTFIQNGGTLTGTLDAPAAGIGPAASGPIEAGKVEGDAISFRVGPATYTGTIIGDRIELRRSAPARGGGGQPRPADTGPHPVIGPPPDGSDPSLGGRFGGAQAPIALKRVNR